jgi:hypothetical protein
MSCKRYGKRAESKKHEIPTWYKLEFRVFPVRYKLQPLDILIQEEQIVGTQEKSQQIVAQRLLSCLQYLDATKSSAKDLSLSPINL